jgi:hypothetical protein
MELAKKAGLSPKDAIRALVKDRYYGIYSYDKSPYRRAFVEEKYPELLKVYEDTENMILLLKDK